MAFMQQTVLALACLAIVASAPLVAAQCKTSEIAYLWMNVRRNIKKKQPSILRHAGTCGHLPSKLWFMELEFGSFKLHLDFVIFIRVMPKIDRSTVRLLFNQLLQLMVNLTSTTGLTQQFEAQRSGNGFLMLCNIASASILQ
jgi:hypothetical protein